MGQPETITITPRIHVGYMISEILMKRHGPNKWWVVWYHTQTLDSGGMKSFDTFEDALKWDLNHPPGKTGYGNEYDRSTIIYSGE